MTDQEYNQDREIVPDYAMDRQRKLKAMGFTTEAKKVHGLSASEKFGFR